MITASRVSKYTVR